MSPKVYEPLTRDKIRSIPCPTCMVPAGSACIHTGKGAAKKNKNGSNHLLRMTTAQEVLEPKDTKGPMLVDDGDDPKTWEFPPAHGPAPAPARRPYSGPPAGQVIAKAYAHVRGVAGRLVGILETRRGIRLEQVQLDILKLRSAADELERLVPKDEIEF